MEGRLLTLIFDEYLDESTAATPAGSAFSVTATPQGGSARTIVGIGIAVVSTDVVVVGLAGRVRSGETVTVSYNESTASPRRLRDRAGNRVGSLVGLPVTNNTPADTTPPTFSSAAVKGNTLTVTFDEDMDESTAASPAGNAFSVTVTSDGTARSIAGTGTAVVDDARVTVTLAGAVAEGETVTVSYTKPASNPLRDASGNEAAGFTDEAATNETDTTPPSLSYIKAAATSVVMTFDEGLDPFSAPSFDAFTVTAAKDGTTRSITLNRADFSAPRGFFVDLDSEIVDNEIVAGETVTVSYTKPASNPLRDPAGNEVASFSNQAVYNIVGDTTAPTVSSAAVNGTTLTVTFDEVLAPWYTPPGSAFTVSATQSGTTRTINGTGKISISGADVTVTLADAVRNGDTVTVAYTKPDTDALSDPAEFDVENFTGQSVTNNTPADTTAPSFVSASMNGATLTVTFSEALDESVMPDGEHVISFRHQGQRFFDGCSRVRRGSRFPGTP